MRKREEEVLSGNLCAMIDVVFQLIIFFVCTVSLQESTLNESIVLPIAPHGQPAKDKSPKEIVIDVDSKGVITIAKGRLSLETLQSIMKKTVAESGQVPVVIRGDGEAWHMAIKGVMDACTAAGLYKIKFAALKGS